MKTQIFKILSAGAIVSTILLASCEGTRRDTDTDKTGGDMNYPSRDNSGSNTERTDGMNNQNQRTMDQNNTDNSNMNNPNGIQKNGGPSNGGNGGNVGTTGRTGKGNDTMPNK